MCETLGRLEFLRLASWVESDHQDARGELNYELLADSPDLW